MGEKNQNYDMSEVPGSSGVLCFRDEVFFIIGPPGIKSDLQSITGRTGHHLDVSQEYLQNDEILWKRVPAGSLLTNLMDPRRSAGMLGSQQK